MIVLLELSVNSNSEKGINNTGERVLCVCEFLISFLGEVQTKTGLKMCQPHMRMVDSNNFCLVSNELNRENLRERTIVVNPS